MNTDQIPYEVATAMLADPKAKQLNTFRKKLRAARSTFFFSKEKKIDQTVRLVRKLSELPWLSLAKMMKRCGRRRMAVQRAWEKTPATWQAARRALEAKAAQFDLLRELCETEGAKRHAPRT